MSVGEEKKKQPRKRKSFKSATPHAKYMLDLREKRKLQNCWGGGGKGFASAS